MKPVWMVVLLATALCARASMAAGAQWEQPAAALAEQIAAILGPGQAHLVLRNASALPAEEIPGIRRLIEEDLKAHGVLMAGAESANSIRITLSENLREQLWVAEVEEGDERRVAMVHVVAPAHEHWQAEAGLTLHTQTVLMSKGPVLAVLETADALVAVEPEELVFYRKVAGEWHEEKRVGVGQKRPLARDARAVILASPGGLSFEAFLAGMECGGANSAVDGSARCHESDDPWPVFSSSAAGGPGTSVVPIKAFYNAGRNYFTGIVTPSVGVELPPFYSASLLPRTDGAGLLINGIDGKVQLAEHNALNAVAGTRDWGSDFAALHSACGSGTQIVVSSSGAASGDSLRAYELPALEAVPVSTPLEVKGAVTALASTADGNSILAIVQAASGDYEVDRVTSTCN